MKLKAPVLLLIVNLAASAPPLIEYVRVAPASASVAVTVVTAVVFSLTLMAAVIPPPLLVIVGAVFPPLALYRCMKIPDVSPVPFPDQVTTTRWFW